VINNNKIFKNKMTYDDNWLVIHDTCYLCSVKEIFVNLFTTLKLVMV